MDEKLGLSLDRGTYMFDNRVPKKTSGPTKDRKRENGEDYIMKRFIICTSQKIFWWGSHNERDNLEDLGIQNRTMLKGAFKKEDGDYIYMADDRYR
jgi:hypothetical protein